MLLHKHEFQVMEYYDPERKKVWKVELQHRHYIKDDYGSTLKDTGFRTVPRVRIDFSEQS